MVCRVAIAGFMSVMLIGAWNSRYRLACMYISFAIKSDILKISLTRRTSLYLLLMMNISIHLFYRCIIISLTATAAGRSVGECVLRKGWGEPGGGEL